MGASEGWNFDQMDVSTAFLYADIDEDVWVEIPEGAPGYGEPGKVWKLKKCLYGLKQASRMWNKKIDGVLP